MTVLANIPQVYLAFPGCFTKENLRTYLERCGTCNRPILLTNYLEGGYFGASLRIGRVGLSFLVESFLAKVKQKQNGKSVSQT